MYADNADCGVAQEIQLLQLLELLTYRLSLTRRSSKLPA